MPTVQVPASFFRKERDQIYARSGWPMVFWRELFQNSVDAGARHVEVAMQRQGSVVAVTHADDGPGCDLATMERVFFRLGETTKTDTAAIGGFGRARIVTHFSQEMYQIRTRDVFAHGEGADYRIVRQKKSKPGFRNDIDIALSDCSEERLRDALLSYLRQCNLPCSVTIDGTPFTDWHVRGRRTRELTAAGEDVPFARVHVNRKGPLQGRAIVRVSGTMMFSEHIAAPAQVTIELDPPQSQRVLVASRDGLAGRYADALSRFQSELSVDTRSALDARPRNRNTLLHAGGLRKTLHPDITPESDPDAPAPGRVQIFARTGPVHLSDLLKSLRLPDIQLIDHAETAALRRAIPRWDPRRWDHERLILEGGGRGERALGLLRAWQAALEAAVEAYLLEREAPDLEWTIGFCFQEETRATHHLLDHGHAFLVNPVDDNGKAAWPLSDRLTLRWLVATAAHEVAHVQFSLHNEDYAGLLTRLLGRIDQAKVVAAMRTAIKEPAR
ncbi:hypothetical protein CKO28_13805 [Rhodovibrio sodomensis]|uniref:ATP-binding protein n=1 Tax=Rhodovibrio sodomensis TaxID=1088 RepID=A0ABS1DGZ4_9PROT|nr:ATP-binding protein [Rhodovibrio sodomensis]MBK1669109.1 hypothetical protein [Rhodovibrio sodomensis]